MGWWVLVAVANVGLFVSMVYMLYTLLRVHNYSPADGMSLDVLHNSGFGLGMLLGTIVVVAGALVLAVLTAHRIAGPYLALLRTFRTIKEGDLSCRLHFRESDRLEALSDEFNKMLESVLARAGDTPKTPTKEGKTAT